MLDALRLVNQEMRAASRDTELELGMSAAQLTVLQALADAPADSLQSLAARTFTRHSSTSVVVRRLVSLGYVARRRSSDDARRVTFTITPAGRELVRATPEAVHIRMSTCAERLPPQRLRALAAGLRSLAHEMAIAREAAHAPVGKPAEPKSSSRAAVRKRTVQSRTRSRTKRSAAS